MDSKEEMILSWMEDEESKELYKARILYRDSFDFGYIQTYIDKYVPLLKGKRYLSISDQLLGKIKKYKAVIVAAMGAKGKCLVKALQSRGINVVGAMDNYWQGEFSGVPVEKPQYYDVKDMCILISQTHGSREIVNSYKNLLSDRIGKGSIIVFDDYATSAIDLSDQQYMDESILKFEDEECFLDVGAFDMYNSKRYIQVCAENSVKKLKIHALEPDKDNYNKCLSVSETFEKSSEIKTRIQVHNCCAYDQNTTLCFEEGIGLSSRINKYGGGID